VQFAPERFLTPLAFSEDLNSSAITAFDACSFALLEGFRRRRLSVHFDDAAVVMRVALSPFAFPVLATATFYLRP
jgi:hypothetical protein